MTVEEIEELVFSRENVVDADISWFTPSGNRRSAPIYEATVKNEYLTKQRTIKARSLKELHGKAKACMATWSQQEVKQRVIAAKKDAKEQAQAEANQADAHAKKNLEELRNILAHTLDIDDKIDWEAEHDTRKFRRFSFRHAPRKQEPQPQPPPPKPGLTWLLRGRYRRWLTRCNEVQALNESAVVRAQEQWERAIREYETERTEAKQQHAREKQAFLDEQKRFNEALVEFRRRFEAGEPTAIVEYCSRVFEQSQYPEGLLLNHTVEYDEEADFVAVTLEVPSLDSLPMIAGYKFVARGNRINPINLKKKEAKELYESVLDQIVIRTVHEVFESCYIPKVIGVVVNVIVTSVNKGTGLDEVERVRTVIANRGEFETFDLTRIDPAACIERLAQGVGQLNQVASS